MNDLSDFRRAHGGAAPTGPTGAAKLLPWARAAVSGGFKIGLLMYFAQIALPHDYKPSVVFGQIAGDTERGDIEAKRETVIAFDRARTDANTQAQTKGQVDAIVAQKTLDTTTESLAPVTAMAGLADGACILGNIVAALSTPTGRVIGDWRNGRTDYDTADLNHAAKAVAGAACGMGDPLRQAVQATQLDAVRTVAAARGMPMTNGAVSVAPDYSPTIQPALPMPTTTQPVAPVSAAPVQVTKVQPVEEHPVTKGRNAAWTNEQQSQLRLYSYHLSGEILQGLSAGLDVRHGYPNAWYDRVAAYQAAHRG